MSDYVTTWRHKINWTEYLNSVQYQLFIVTQCKAKVDTFNVCTQTAL